MAAKAKTAWEQWKTTVVNLVGSSEADGETEDMTLVCKVLRKYYAEEKKLPLPAWLPPDPTAPQPVVAQVAYSQSTVGSTYGGGLQNPQQSGSSNLGSIFDQQRQPRQTEQPPQSLRQGRGAASRPNPFSRQQASPEPIAARPLPSAREGSYQATSFGRNEPSLQPTGSKANLKARFNPRTASPANLTSAPKMANPITPAQRSNSYGSSSAGGNYEDRFAPNGGSDKPYLSATSPWMSDGPDLYGGGGASDPGRSAGGRLGGLPSGPGAGRRGPGLPNGPRMR